MATETRSLQITTKMQDQATAGFAKLLAVGRGVAGSLVTAFKGLGITLGAISATAATAFVAFRRVAADLDAVAKASDRLGVSAESLTALRNGAELAGVSFEELTNSVRFFERFVDEANQGGRKQRQVLAELGLTAEELSGSNLDLVEILGRVGDGLNGLGGSAEKTNTLLQLFGRSGSNLAPLLQQGSTGIQKLATEARALGAVFTREELARVEAFNDSWDELKQTFGALFQQIAVQLSPAFTELFEAINTYLKDNSESTKRSVLELTETFVESFKILAFAVDTFRSVVTGWELITKELALVTAKLQGNSDAANILERDLAALGVNAQLIQKDFGSANGELDKMLKRLQELRSAAAKGTPIRVQVTGDAPGAEPDVVEPGAWERFQEGARKASLQWRDFAQTAYQSGQVLVGGTLDALTDNIGAAISRTKSWGQAWKDLGKSVLGILANVIAKLLTVRVLSALFGSSAGGGSTVAKADGGVEPGSIKGVLPLQRFAMGGIARGPTLALMGEGKAPAEAFVPLPDGKTIPVSFRGAGGGAGGGQVVNIVQNFHSTDARGTYELFRQNRGTIRQFVTDDMQRRNGFRGTVKGAAR
ncbi:MAG: hypothetical protein JNM25_06960 [Planctomycetes bacterium]|nr:hypothetical protein [Planctomycetota bacterium]